MEFKEYLPWVDVLMSLNRAAKNIVGMIIEMVKIINPNKNKLSRSDSSRASQHATSH